VDLQELLSWNSGVFEDADEQAALENWRAWI
jgi:hypothetical protein